MKKILVSMMLAALGLGATSCQKDTERPEGGTPRLSFKIATPKAPLVLTRAAIASSNEWNLATLDVYAANAGTVSKLAADDYSIFPALSNAPNQTYTITLGEEWLRARTGQEVNFYFVGNDASSTNGPHDDLVSTLDDEAAFKNAMINGLTDNGDGTLEPITAPDGTAAHNLLFSTDIQALQISSTMEETASLKRREARFDIQNKNAAPGVNQLVVTGIEIINASNSGLIFGAGDAATTGIDRTNTINIGRVDPAAYTETAPGSDVANDLATSVFYLYPTTLAPVAEADKTQIVVHAEYLGVEREYPLVLTDDQLIEANFRYILKLNAVAGTIDIVGDEYEEGGTFIATPGQNSVVATLTPDMAAITGNATFTTAGGNVFAAIGGANVATMPLTAASEYGTTFALTSADGSVEAVKSVVAGVETQTLTLPEGTFTVTKQEAPEAPVTRAFEGVEEIYTITIPAGEDSAEAKLTISSGRIGEETIMLRRMWGGDASAIVYMDNDGTITAGSWDEIVAANAQRRVMLFKFGGVIGMDAANPTGDGAWNDQASKFNPAPGVNHTDYAAIPSFTAADYAAGIRNISDAAYNTAENIRAGKGDICTLLGLKVSDIASMTDDELNAYIGAAGWRMPTVMENVSFVGGPAEPQADQVANTFWTNFGAVPYVNYNYRFDESFAGDANTASASLLYDAVYQINDGTLDDPNAVKFPVEAQGDIAANAYTLPTLGYRGNDGGLYRGSADANYWASTPRDNATGYWMHATYQYVYPVGANPCTQSMAIRCVSPTGAEIPAAKSEAFVEVAGVKWAKQNLTSEGYFATKDNGVDGFFQWGSPFAWTNTGAPARLDGTEATWPAAVTNTNSDPWPAASDPCPTGWRLPTAEDFAALGAGTWVTEGGKYATNGYEFADATIPTDVVFFPAAGMRASTDGTFGGQTSNGAYWSSTASDATKGIFMDFNNPSLNANNSAEYSNGYSIRCVMDDGGSTPEPEPVAHNITINPATGLSALRATNGVGGSTIATATAGTTVGLKATLATHYSFTNWTVINDATSEPVAVTGSTSVSSASFTMPDALVTVTPAATAKLYKLTATFDANGDKVEVTPVEATMTGVPNSQEITLTPTAKSGYWFTGWTVENGGANPTGYTTTENPLKINLTGDVTIKANFAPLYKLTVTAGANGSTPSVSPSEATSTGVASTQMVTITPKPDDGYTFKNWTLVDGTEPTYFHDSNYQIKINLTGDVTIKANYEQLPADTYFWVIIDYDGNVVDHDTAKVDEEVSIRDDIWAGLRQGDFEFSPDIDFEFRSSPGYENLSFYMPDENVVIEVDF